MTVEFALVLVVFLMLVFGAIDLSRWLFAIVSIGEATRVGARVAAVCDLNDTAIREHMVPGLISATGGTTTIAYLPSGCVANAATGTPCTGLTVTVSGYSVPKVAWFLPNLQLPTITTYLTRESLTSANNARCD